jgi:diacylglycerol kinase family enzyme
VREERTGSGPDSPVPPTVRTRLTGGYADLATSGRAEPHHPLFMLNPGAGGGRCAAQLRRLSRHWGVGSGGTVVEIRSLDDARRVVDQLTDETVPVAVGGDGTVGLVAAALLQSGRRHQPLGILPFGTANLLARAVGIRDTRGAVAALRHGEIRPIDVFITSDRAIPVSLVGISAGFEGRFMSRYS